MPATDSTRIIQCPKCAARFEVAASMAGKRARCAACETGFEIPGAEPPKKNPSLPEFISVDCRVCGTRLTGRSEYIGKKVKCPDCGAGTVLPPPEKPRPKNMPAALEGEQYELWDVDDQPLPSEMIAAQPRFISVMCDKCGTLMHAHETQAGQKIACPDCGMKNTIPFTPRPVKKKSVLAADRETPQIDPTTIPGDVPFLMPQTHGITLAEQEAADEYQRALEKSKRTGKPMEIDERGRPVLPAYPLISGVLPFLLTSGVPAWWLGLSAGFACSLTVFLYGVQMASALNILGVFLLVFGCVLVMVCSAAAFSVLMQIVVESSTGNRQVLSWPSFMDWFGSLLYLIVGGMASAFPGWAIAHIPPLSSSPVAVQLLTIGSIVICFPVILLSQLDHDMTLAIASGRVLKSLARCPFTWAFLYFECAVIVAICAIITLLVFGGPDAVRTVFHQGVQVDFVGRPLAVWWLAPLYMLAAIVVTRLLGRLGWRISEAMPDDEPKPEENEEVRPRGPKNYNPPRPSRRTT